MVIIERFYTPGLAQIAYGVADSVTKSAAIIDPRRDIDDYVSWAEDHDFQLVAGVETHVHADFVSGARELAEATGATMFAGRLGDTAFPHQPLDDGDVVSVGSLRLQAFWTPGHTPEHLSYLLFDPAQGKDPVAIFTGDALFAGEVGRPDLLGNERTSELIDQLYWTVSERLASLPDALTVYPGHGAGSPCGRKIGDAAQTTIGREKQINYAFQARSKEEFARAIMEGMPRPPAYYPTMKRVNKAGPALLRELPEGERLSADEIASWQQRGALIIDARPTGEFAAGHIPGSVSVGLGESFAIWSGWLTPYDREVVLLLPHDADFVAARTELRRIGIDTIAGYLGGGFAAWRASGGEVATLQEMSVAELRERLDLAGNGFHVLDVRDATEWASGHIPGAMHAPAGELAQGEGAPIAGTSPVAVVCGSGFRAAVAASMLQRHGLRNVSTVTGGMEAWTNAGLPTVSDS
jgi:hydroxyacylglutathione hydrolase